MPIPVMAQTAPPPQGGKLTKAAFFRARSPPIVSPTSATSANSRASRNDPQEPLDDSMYARFNMPSNGTSAQSRSIQGAIGYGEERDRFDGGYSGGSGLGAPQRESIYNTPATAGHGPTLDRRISHPNNPRYDPQAQAPSSYQAPSIGGATSQSSHYPTERTHQPYSHTRQSSRSKSLHSRTGSTSSRRQLPLVTPALSQVPDPSVLSPRDSDSGYGESMETSESQPRGDYHLRGGYGTNMRDNEGELGRSRSARENGNTSLTEGSDEMLLSLLAGQAVMDCQQMGIAGWEDVEGWKKELSLLSSRVDSVQARHQREIKILTAARALQKLNNSNKRMSRQTLESLEQSEKKVAAVEKDLLTLRDREASVRRQVLEHFGGVMSWEVKRLERINAEVMSRFEGMQARMDGVEEKEAELVRDVQEGRMKVEELEAIVSELQRREQAFDDETRQLEDQIARAQQDQSNWQRERSQIDQERQAWMEEKEIWDRQAANFDAERRRWAEEKEALFGDREKMMQQSGQSSERDRKIKSHVQTTLGALLGRRAGQVDEEEIVPAFEQLRTVLSEREREIMSLREEVREVNMGLEQEVRRVGEDRDAWKAKVEKGEAMKQEEVASLERSLRQQQDQITNLTLRNESLSSSLAAAQSTLSVVPSPSTAQGNEQRNQALSAELEEIAKQFASIWPLLPSRAEREKADLIDPRTGQSNKALASPSNSIRFEALQALYAPGRPTSTSLTSIPEALSRIKGMVEDGELLVDRVVRMGKERETLKTNAAKAKKLVEGSTRSLQTYQQQVTILEDRLAKSSQSESHFLDELNSLQSLVDTNQQAKRTLEQKLAQQMETCNRLSEANDTLSARALELAQVAEDEKRALQQKLQGELEETKRKLNRVEEDADEDRAKSTGQNIQLLDELNSLQAEVGSLRTQLRNRR
ncbi:hypothetical protein L198_04038 [Cryptococcus wingfieldii CBS 7118]|uniref:Up-regulated during septation protein 1 domain-containing protein n=1 Tax=Cryptococcus wingfieldii CBS 7118 TaxID=1295528 RepID=A0A1E3JC32_9TREE|nr:hypothetical protein L198_04038 [Cryptococcus wingfieldii CBS 7118]ODN97471.1 hypothetical protein L198_04038 [Cryptococcus wingfieldii CBS 7118]